MWVILFRVRKSKEAFIQIVYYFCPTLVKLKLLDNFSYSPPVTKVMKMYSTVPDVL